ncbi:hypothetical protein LUZ60_004647 [Juncus effusus]|nr:hypothetical protein LUZ60_004647 [Juncus effusus]
MNNVTSFPLPCGGLKVLFRTPKINHIPKLRDVKPIEKAKYRCSAVQGLKETAGVKKKEKITVYKDNWFDLLAIQYLSRNLQSASGLINERLGYDNLMEVAIMVSRNFEAERQWELVIKSLEKALPSFLRKMIKSLFPPSKFSREIFATFTTLFFAWLVGPCEVRESEHEGRREKNVVYIPKCRFLESTKCVGTCTNMCKIPCQKFIHDSLGMPVYMIPNFEDMSCEMKFGEKPPINDPTLSQPCYSTQCVAKQWHGLDCST